ncbi:hypothetical protein [Actinoplanes sp. NPDC049265]|uniref:hypothetical protein n=1 Tax=Actinoplanes sp. NPDC049265 TaxID=3363902 RepID=UPI00371771EC
MSSRLLIATFNYQSGGHRHTGSDSRRTVGILPTIGDSVRQVRPVSHATIRDTAPTGALR